MASKYANTATTAYASAAMSVVIAVPDATAMTSCIFTYSIWSKQVASRVWKS